MAKDVKEVKEVSANPVTSIVNDTPKMPEIKIFRENFENPLVIHNEKDFPQYVFSWTSEEEIQPKRNCGWCFVPEDLGVVTNGFVNSFGRIAYKELTLMYHVAEFMEARKKHMDEITKMRTSGIAQKLRKDADACGIELVDPRTELRK